MPPLRDARRRAYLAVVVGAFGLQLLSAWWWWGGSWLVMGMNSLGMLLCLVMLVLIWRCFRVAVIHSLGLLLAFGWVVVDALHAWLNTRALSADVLLETVVLALLAFTFWPARAAAVLTGLTFAMLLVLDRLAAHSLSFTLLLTGFVIVLIGFMAVYGWQISAAQARSDVLGELAYRDPLTGLANRHVADEALALLAEHAQPERVALVLFDLDHFKAVNDSLGHLAGDHALQHVAGLLRGFVRSTDLLSRWGGEEFLLVWHGITPQQARERSEAILAQVRGSALEGFPSLTISCGGVMLDEVGSVAQALARADQRLYQAKAQGRDCAVWGGRKMDDR